MTRRSRLLALAALLAYGGVLGGCASTIRTVQNLPGVPGGGPPPGSGIPQPDLANLQPDLTRDAAEFRIRVNGQKRSFVLRLYPGDAPKTVANFQYLVDRKFYDGLAVHRVIPNFLVQTGDPLSRTQGDRAVWGTGGPGYEIPGEPGLPHRAGMAGMARVGDLSSRNRSSHGSQFYITLARRSELNGRYTVFGEVIQGYDALQELVEVPADANDNPLERVEILSARLAPATDFIPENRDSIERSQERLSDEAAAKRNPGFFGRLVRRYW